MKVRIGCHTFRATGISAYLQSGGSLESARTMAAPDWPGYPGMVDPAGLAAARHALTCGGLAQLQHAVRDPMTFGRFLQNLGGAFGNSTLVVPANPFVAEQQFCGSPG